MPHVSSTRLPAPDGVVVTAAGVEAFDCPICGGPRDLVVDPELDGARACVDCGVALLVDPVTTTPARVRRSGTARFGRTA